MTAVPLVAADLPANAPVDFNRDIRPILADTCYTCHGPDEKQRQAELRLDTREGAFAERDGKPPIVSGKPADSELYRRLTTADDDRRMPPASSGRQLTAAQIDLVRRWIEQGAGWQAHWSFVAPVRPELPQVAATGWPRNGIDHFILSRLEKEQWQPAPEADRETLIRRVTLDLTGLPPTLEEVDAFLNDKSTDAYERVVDRLLKSPRYGERMVLPWLDAARYSDTNGYQTDGTRAMWPWRDWAIAALNDNMPFDRFTVEQIAGDLLPEPTLPQKLATGFHRNHMLNGEGGRIAEESRVDYVVDRVETTSTVWLGLTAGCARCHDHKYDPLSQREFYSLYAYFNNVDETGAVDRRSSTAAPTIELPTPEQETQRDELTRAIAATDARFKQIDKSLIEALPEWEEITLREKTKVPEAIDAVFKIPADKRSDAQKKELADFALASNPVREAVRKTLERQRQELDALNKSITITMIMEERKSPRETFILDRGQYDKPVGKVEPQVPAIFPPLPAGAAGNRLGLARWLVDPANPLTARVTVNRFWQLFFGAGLVRTTEDFGAQGERPSHPELLDWLAVEFVAPAADPQAIPWDMKRMHKLIVMSAAYRQSSRASARLLEQDPGNRLLARGPRYRWSSFELRDQALSLAGLLTEKIGGPPVRPYQPAGIWEDFSFGKIAYKQDHGSDLYRRSLYTFWRRSIGPTSLFDTSTRQVCTVRETRTNTPLHALVLLNDTTYVEAARAFAERALTMASTTEEQLSWLFRSATARYPRSEELAVLVRQHDRLKEQFQEAPESAGKLLAIGESPRRGDIDPVDHAAMTGIASLVLNLDEVLNKE